MRDCLVFVYIEIERKVQLRISNADENRGIDMGALCALGTHLLQVIGTHLLVDFAQKPRCSLQTSSAMSQHTVGVLREGQMPSSTWEPTTPTELSTLRT